jgi:hypothetical protein
MNQALYAHMNNKRKMKKKKKRDDHKKKKKVKVKEGILFKLLLFCLSDI